MNDIPVSVVHERVRYYGSDGKLITESLKDSPKKTCKTNLPPWMNFWAGGILPKKKEELIQELAEHGVLLEALREEVGKDLDAFDLICHVAFDQPPLTLKERTNNVRKRNYFAKYGAVAQNVLNSLLDKYEADGISFIETGSGLKVKPLNELGSPVKLVRAFGKKKDLRKPSKNSNRNCIELRKASINNNSTAVINNNYTS